jgi:uncharacterized membrane protein
MSASTEMLRWGHRARRQAIAKLIVALVVVLTAVAVALVIANRATSPSTVKPGVITSVAPQTDTRLIAKAAAAAGHRLPEAASTGSSDKPGSTVPGAPWTKSTVPMRPGGFPCYQCQ